jgi:tetratricopeptide (TPR) repeat protein
VLDALHARYWLGAAHYQAQNSDEARAIFAGILEQLHAGIEAPPDFRGRVLIALANSEIWGGNAKTAAAYLEEARSIADEMDDRRRATFLLSLALSYRDSGDLEGAIRAGQRSLALFSALDARREEIILENSLALAYLGLGSTGKASSHARRAQALAEQIEARELDAHIADTQAQIAIARRDWPRAIELASEAVAQAERDGNEQALVDGLISRSRAAAAQGELDSAVADLRRAATITERHGATRQRRTALTELGDLLARQGQHEEAVTLYREVVQLS